LKAVVKKIKGKGNVELQDVSVPKVGSNEVLIKVHYTGICGTDIHIWKDEFPVYYPPVTLGHEFSGEIIEVGPDVKNWSPGDRVVSELQNLSCGTCRFCRTGKPHGCISKRSPGWGINGSFAEHIKMPTWLLHKIPDNVSYKEAALVEPAAISSQAVFTRTGIEPGDFVVVLGPGPIGLIAAQLAKINGACSVLITGTKQDVDIRLPLAKHLGIDYILNGDKEDPVKRIKELTDGDGADVVIEATGVENAVNQAFEMVRWGGKIGVVGLSGKNKLNVKWTMGSFKAIDVRFSFSSQYQDWRIILKLLEKKKLNLKDLITHEFKLSEWEKAFETIVKGEAVKVLLKPGN